MVDQTPLAVSDTLYVNYNRRSRGKRSNQKDAVRLWDEPILLDPHTYNKYKHEDYLRSDIHTSWLLDTLVGSIGIYINDKNAGRAPIHPTQHFLGNFVQSIIHQASDITKDDRNTFLAAHRDNFVCYSYTLNSDTYRSRKEK
ncbi:hypothetical protein PENSPDRAFT_671921 [Peniophora sp. CONT]|nr:hypothetical protein PENSPDRAFT_671921 [Peniophora sp. CONT]